MKLTIHFIISQCACFFCFFTFFAAIQLCWLKQNPIKAVPKAQHKDLFIRIVAGQLTFGLICFAYISIPIATAAILNQTSPFWISIMACCILNEKILLLEVAGILICFVGVVIVGIGKQERIESAGGED